MKRDIEWVEKLDDGVKRISRIAFRQGKIVWQFKRSDQPQWDYTSPASPEDWAKLEAKIDQLYYRRRAGYGELELVRLMRKKYGSVPPPEQADASAAPENP